jgi:hypothetical protein
MEIEKKKHQKTNGNNGIELRPKKEKALTNTTPSSYEYSTFKPEISTQSHNSKYAIEATSTKKNTAERLIAEISSDRAILNSHKVNIRCRMPLAYKTHLSELKTSQTAATKAAVQFITSYWYQIVISSY